MTGLSSEKVKDSDFFFLVPPPIDEQFSTQLVGIMTARLIQSLNCIRHGPE